MIENRLRHPLNIDDEHDAKFIYDLVRKQSEREQERREFRRYSPSQLASCLRQVYLKRNYDGPRKRETRIEPNFYFLTGDWLHLKWQYVLYRMDKEGTEGFELIDVEVSVVSKRGDHGGTIDATVKIHGEPMPVDFKGLNVRAFQKACYGDVDLSYKVQLCDYMILNNSQRKTITEQFNRGLLVIENKGGPDPKHPIALTEIKVGIEEFRPEVRWRLEELRKHEEENSVPEPECDKTTSLQFQGCPFRDYCRKDVKEIAKRNAENSNTEGFRVKSSDRKRVAGTRGNSKR